MSTAVNHTSAPSSSRSPPTSANHAHNDPAYANGEHHHHHHSGSSYQGASSNAKKAKQKKVVDPSETTRQLQAKIAQLESANLKEDEEAQEVERDVKVNKREMNQAITKLDDVAKIDYLSSKATEFFREMKRTQLSYQKEKKARDQLQKEKDRNGSELSKSVTLREKLEKLCRELQRENNRLKGENKTLQDNEKENLANWDAKYQDMLWNLQDYQEEKDHPQAQIVPIEVDDLFKQRFKSLIDQYELRELHFHSLMRTKELEVQYNMARFEREKKNAESEINRSRTLNAQVLTFSKTESELRNQLNIYVEKFKQVEDTLNNSNDLFLTFRKEMEEMSKKTKRLEKENLTLTRKQDLTNRNILEMAEERTQNNQERDSLVKKNEKLTNIINQMQQQGRGLASGMADTVDGRMDGDFADEDDQEGSDSEYGFGEEEGEEGSDAEYDEDTEEELHAEVPKKAFGPPPPPPTTNGANGIKH
ncbi:muscle-derived protein (neurite-outgrowth-promoting) [Phlyctema vagabunda]|uniref:Muscle-derived protein (Neurite-outgrowth-promoting) n=1 Tax=Phlyctema vagabunda TaxID=108571 RepID=A0ABR4PYT4_9HELO